MGSIIKFEELSEEKRRELQNIYGQIGKIITFSNKANLNLFKHLFGERMGEHLFVEVFVKKCNRDIMKFIKALDSDNKTIMFFNIFDEETSQTMYAYC